MQVCRERYAHAERQVFSLGRLLELTTGALRLAEEEVEARDNELEMLRWAMECTKGAVRSQSKLDAVLVFTCCTFEK